jgi:hypothetical protein
LRKIDVNSLINRFNNKYSDKLTAASLNVYASRIRSAFKNFFDYAANPATFKPSSALKNKIKNKTTEKKPTEKKREEQTISSELKALPSVNSIINTTTVPIRQDLTIQILGLPFDLTRKEADKITNIIKGYSLAED